MNWIWYYRMPPLDLCRRISVTVFLILCPSWDSPALLLWFGCGVSSKTFHAKKFVLHVVVVGVGALKKQHPKKPVR